MQPAIERLTTDRLAAERIREEHLPHLLEMHSDPRVMATLGGQRSEGDTRRFLARQLDHWERHGFGLWMVFDSGVPSSGSRVPGPEPRVPSQGGPRDRVSGRFVGRAGLRVVRLEEREEVEIAYAFMAHAWGRGLATEMARELVRVGFEELKLPEIVGFTDLDNHASRRVMEKAGMRLDHEFAWEGLPHALYRIARSTEASNV